MSNVLDFGAVGDGRTDTTDAIQHAVDSGDGLLEFPPGDYLITRTISLDLDRTGRVGIHGAAGTAKIVMAGAGPAFHMLGTHDGTALPADFQPHVWARQRLPTVLNIEVLGRHPEACGFLVDGTMQSTFEGVLIREMLDGIHIRRRARNVLISHCHIYHNSGTGILLDEVNLHQAIISASHISYCLRGGIRIVGSEIRNLQITGNDIEYNFDPTATESADVWIDSSADHASVREGTIASNTIQASSSPGGANIRVIGHNPQENHQAGMLAITGNLIGSQETNVHLVACRGVTLVGNVIYSGDQANLRLDGCRNIVMGSNCFDHNPDYQQRELCTAVRLVDSRDCTFSGSIIHDCQAGQHTVDRAQPIVRDGLLEIVGCQRINISGCELLDGHPVCLHVADSSQVSVTGCTLLDSRADKLTQAAIRWRGPGSGNHIAANTIGRGLETDLDLDAASGVKVGDNLLLP
jgi:polygalacturonase